MKKKKFRGSLPATSILQETQEANKSKDDYVDDYSDKVFISIVKFRISRFKYFSGKI